MSLLTKREGRFYDRWEEADQEERKKATRTRLHSYVEWASQLSFYQMRLKAYDPKSPQPLQNIKPLQSSELRQVLPPESNELVVPGTASYNVFQSGGTTGTPKTSLFSHSELDALDLPNARGFFACGLREKDKVANLFAVGSLYMTFVHINRMLQSYGCINFPFANNSLTEFIHTVTKQFRINVFTGVSSIVLNALREFEAFGTKDLKIEKIFFGGENLYEADKEEIRKKFGTQTILAPGYGTVDTWYIGYQCEQTPPGVFHAHDDQCFIEIVDEESGAACGPGQKGMLYATAFPRRITPIVRYRVGDLAAWIESPCPCGRTTPLFQLFGRGDDVLRIGYDSVDYNSIQESVKKVPGLSGSVQIEKQRIKGRDKLIVRVESELSNEDKEEAKKMLLSKILASRPGLQDLQKKQLIWPLEAELVPLNSLERNVRTGKLLRVKDCL